MLFDIRPACSEDLAQIMAIKNAEILHGTANWSEDPQTLDQFQNWFEHLQQNNYPLLVAHPVDSTTIAAYADYDAFSQIQGYRQTVEHSVFVHPDYNRQGLGQRLMLALIEHAKAQKIHVMVAAIDHVNVGSILLHEKLGFKQTGYMPQVGQKFGQWRDLVLMQRQLDSDLST